MYEMSLILIMLSLGASIIFIGIVLAIASIDECNYRNELYKQHYIKKQWKDKQWQYYTKVKTKILA